MYNCKDCCFAKVENEKQVECLADKYKYLKCEDSEEKSTDNNFFQLNRLCLYKRKRDWKKEDTNESRLDTARKQLFPNIGICLDDDSEDPDDLENVINQIINLDYPRNKVKVIIYSHFNKAGARIPGLLSKMRSKNVICWSVFIVSNDIPENETSVFKKLAEATFLAKLSSKTKVDLQKTVNKINEISNDELKPVLAFKNEDALFLNKSFVSSAYLDYLDYSKMEEAILNKVTNTEYLYNIT